MDISAGGSFGRMLGARNILPRSEMWQMGFENMMQSESHKERLSIYVTRHNDCETNLVRILLFFSDLGS